MMNIMQIMNNPLIKMAMNSKNPQQFMINVIKQNPQFSNNQLLQNFVNMYQNGDYKGIETLGRNMVKEIGENPDKLLKEAQNVMK